MHNVNPFKAKRGIGISPREAYLARFAARHAEALLAAAPDLVELREPAKVVYFDCRPKKPLVLIGDRCQVSQELSRLARERSIDPYIDPLPSQIGAHLFVVGPKGLTRGYVPWSAVEAAKEDYADEK